MGRKVTNILLRFQDGNSKPCPRACCFSSSSVKVGGEVQTWVSEVKQEVLLELGGNMEAVFSPCFERSTRDDLREG